MYRIQTFTRTPCNNTQQFLDISKGRRSSISSYLIDGHIERLAGYPDSTLPTYLCLFLTESALFLSYLHEYEINIARLTCTNKRPLNGTCAGRLCTPSQLLLDNFAVDLNPNRKSLKTCWRTCMVSTQPFAWNSAQIVNIQPPKSRSPDDVSLATAPGRLLCKAVESLT